MTWVESWMLTEWVLWLGDSNYPSSSVLYPTDWCMSSPSLFRDRLNIRFALYRWYTVCEGGVYEEYAPL